jgi:hypothetical protein
VFKVFQQLAQNSKEAAQNQSKLGAHTRSEMYRQNPESDDGRLLLGEASGVNSGANSAMNSGANSGMNSVSGINPADFQRSQSAGATSASQRLSGFETILGNNTTSSSSSKTNSGSSKGSGGSLGSGVGNMAMGGMGMGAMGGMLKHLILNEMFTVLKLNLINNLPVL